MLKWKTLLVVMVVDNKQIFVIESYVISLKYTFMGYIYDWPIVCCDFDMFFKIT